MSICWEIWILQIFPIQKGIFFNLKTDEARVAIFIFNVPARTMKREREALAGVPLLIKSFFPYFIFVF